MKRAILAALALAACASHETGRISAPALVGEGVISTPINEFGGGAGPGGELYFSISAQRSYMYAIAVSHFERGRWSAPAIAPFSMMAKNFDPVLSPDGRRLYFISDRAPEGGLWATPNQDVWRVERPRVGAPWGAPQRLALSSPTLHEVFVSEAADGTLYLAAQREQRGADIFIARRNGAEYGPLEPIGAPVDTSGLEGEPMIAPDQSFLLFSAYERAGGQGDWDIYISRREGAGWSAPVNLGPLVNTSARDYSPRLGPDGHTLYFSSERNFRTGHAEALTTEALEAGLAGVMNGNGNLYSIDLRTLGVLP